jgi:radical SAM/Cys-rich protein
MHLVRPLLLSTQFPEIRRGHLITLQMNLGYLCNMSCNHCHVDAGPKRREIMDMRTIDDCMDFVMKYGIETVDLTGGAPEMNPHFRPLVESLRGNDVHVIDRCNLTILEQEGYQDIAEFMARQRVEITASLPCYLEDNVDRQRGKGVFQSSIAGLERLNRLGYGQPDSKLKLNLVYNPQDTDLPPPQQQLHTDYSRHLKDHFGIVFNELYSLANMPIQRFGSKLVSQGRFGGYIQLLKDNFQEGNLESVMCRDTLSVDWRGFLYDCDFNQMLGIPLGASDHQTMHIRSLKGPLLQGKRINTGLHCYGCTAGQGSSCGGALGETDSE